jgi:hypothetical protein
MNTTTLPLRLAGFVLATTLSACASPDPVAYSGLASASRLAPNRADDARTNPYRYGETVSWRNYDKIIIDPVTIYRGPDQQFGDLSEQDKADLARVMKEQFTRQLSKRFTLVNTPGPNTLRLALTLTGAATNTPVLSTLTRFDLAGGLYNGVQSARGGEGMMSGSVLYATEIYDASTQQLLRATVSKQYPNAYNLGASIGSLAAARTGIEKGAEELAEALK